MKHSLTKKVVELSAIADIKKNSHYVYVTNKGELVKKMNDICYARVVPGYHASFKAITKLRIYINQHKSERVNTKNFYRWLEWVANESYWKDALVVPKNWEKVGIAIKCKYNLPYAMGAAIAIREGYEYPHSLDAWVKMVDAGVHPALAHVASYYFTSKHEGEGYQEYCSKGHHGCLPLDISVVSVKAYVEGRIKHSSRKPMNKDIGAFTGIWDVFYKDKELPLQKIVDKHKTVEGKGWDTKITRNLNDAFISDLLVFQKELQNA